MEIIPVINCSDTHCVEKRMRIISALGASWVQIDVSDGIFSPVELWNEKSQISNLKSQISKFPGINMEVHLMVRHPLDVVREWIDFGAKRIIFHAETITPEEIEVIKEKVQIGIALLPDTPAHVFDKFSDIINFIQVLAVHQGFSGQIFNDEMIQKIKSLRDKYPHIEIEVDGGVTQHVAEKIKHAGATIATAGSFIFDSKDPNGAYKKLREAE